MLGTMMVDFFMASPFTPWFARPIRAGRKPGEAGLRRMRMHQRLLSPHPGTSGASNILIITHAQSKKPTVRLMHAAFFPPLINVFVGFFLEPVERSWSLV